jgi:exopolysaccharide biosynthesis protein
MKLSKRSKIIFLFIVSISYTESIAQKLKLKASSEIISPGIELKVIKSRDLFQSHQYISIISIDPAQSLVEYSFSKSIIREKTTDQASKMQMDIAINGSFFNMDNGEPACFLKINDTIKGVSRYDLKPNYFLDQLEEGGVIIKENSLHIFQKPECRGWISMRESNIMESGPLLIWENTILKQEDISFNTNRFPRSGLCITNDNKVLLFAVDGGANEAAGMSIPEFAMLMKDMGCKEGINLDGGGSTTLWLKDKGVINHPTDNKSFDHFGERPVSNIISIKIKQ